MKVAASSAENAAPTRIGDSLISRMPPSRSNATPSTPRPTLTRASHQPLPAGSPLASKRSGLVRNLGSPRLGLARHREDACGDLRPRDDPGRLRPWPVARDNRRQQPDQAGGQGRRIGSREDASRGGDRVPQAWHVVADRDGTARRRLRHHEPPALADGRGDQSVRASRRSCFSSSGTRPRKVTPGPAILAKPRLLGTASDHPHLRIGHLAADEAEGANGVLRALVGAQPTDEDNGRDRLLLEAVPSFRRRHAQAPILPARL